MENWRRPPGIMWMKTIQ